MPAIAKLSSICKTWSKALVPALKKHIEDVRCEMDWIEGEEKQIPHPNPKQIYVSRCYDDGPNRKYLLGEWYDYMCVPKRYGTRLLVYFRND